MSFFDDDAEASTWKVNSVILNEYIVERELGQLKECLFIIPVNQQTEGTAIF